MDQWTQLSLDTSNVVTEVCIRIGAAGTSHSQWLVEARDDTGALVAMVSSWHLDLAKLDSGLARAVAVVTQIIEDRHSPF